MQIAYPTKTEMLNSKKFVSAKRKLNFVGVCLIGLTRRDMFLTNSPRNCADRISSSQIGHLGSWPFEAAALLAFLAGAVASFDPKASDRLLQCICGMLWLQPGLEISSPFAEETGVRNAISCDTQPVAIAAKRLRD